jgi:predicted DNA-binding transcriptional regulator AlpA
MKLNESTRNFDALPDGAWVPVRTASTVAGVSDATVWRWAKDGRLTAKKIGVRNTRFSVREIRALLSEGSAA